MKRISLIFISLISLSAVGQSTSGENRDLKFDALDLKIIKLADSILSDPSKWNKQDDRECKDDITAGRYSLYCALYKASMDVLGEYIHRRAGMQVVRFTLEKYENGRVKEHRLMDWNNHPDTSFEEVKKVLKEAIETVKKQVH
ncbi:hypothetical protein WSM22_30590 [Cytophagales bacterium WSM2-2]|nr:hypothetical protein WSM22_30590 [Cytophagales bacterium WSM2-2]